MAGQTGAATRAPGVARGLRREGAGFAACRALEVLGQGAAAPEVTDLCHPGESNVFELFFTAAEFPFDQEVTSVMLERR